jgi:hypothetical protein
LEDWKEGTTVQAKQPYMGEYIKSKLVVIDAEPVGCVQLRNPPLAYGYMNDKA